MIFFHKFKIFALFFFVFLTNCQLKETTKSHGILFLENRLNSLKVNISNTNDVLRLIGSPHSKSIDENVDTWIYIERVIGRGEYHKLGQPKLIKNNVAIISFNKYGILKEKKIYKKEDIRKLKFSEKDTENIMSRKSFVEKFLSSVKSKMYGNK